VTALDDLTVAVYGRPRPQGSKVAYAIKRGRPSLGETPAYTGGVRMFEQNDPTLRAWRQDVIAAVRAQISCGCGQPGCDLLLDGFPWTGPVAASMIFTFARPASHHRTGRNSALLRAGAPAKPTGPPDLGKLARAVEDALTVAGVYRDDAQIVEYLRLAKAYAGHDPDGPKREGLLLRLYHWPGATRTVEPPGVTPALW
jgi:hypothetical protein